ncbi:class II aldolase/adducin family protein [Ovoidimarina sediminis]|uniref:class II aldolase/adducin family protein n=1 Tax=Ovoidimarina sediminis TaxID=3079856 RepID=UPI002912F047|nr:class II aldolase/adducin family protein [Rhodophyticola sp. MJ-SS7]MDU8941758.1 class II aldolase/adducin family protein [Rhodophyticola sp. MJ-SS7]
MPASGGPVAPERIADVAAAARILAARGVVDGFGHVSMRHPDAPDRYLMSRALAPALVMPEDIVEYDLESEACDPDAPKGFLERFIHGQIYAARPDVNAVVHSHSPSVIPFGIAKAPMQACFHNAAFLAGGVPVFDIWKHYGATDMLVSDNEKGGKLAECLADRPVALMRAHGSVACGRSLEVAVFRAVYTEVNARVQHWAGALAEEGEELAVLRDEEGVLADVPNQTAGMRAWDLWRREIRDTAGW